MYAIQITLTTANTAYSLLALLQEVDPAVPGECAELTLEANAANAAGSLVSVGDLHIATDRYGYQLGPGDAKVYSSRGNRNFGSSVPLADIWLTPSANGLKMNVEVLR